MYILYHTVKLWQKGCCKGLAKKTLANVIELLYQSLVNEVAISPIIDEHSTENELQNLSCVT